jgi:hypothetical protein
MAKKAKRDEALNAALDATLGRNDHLRDLTGGIPAKPRAKNSGKTKSNQHSQDTRDSQDDSQGDAEPWERIVPLGEHLDLLPFPLEVFPGALRDFVSDAAAALAAPPEYVAVPMLVMAGGAIGASRALEIKPGWTERPCLYAAVVGLPGSARTPALKRVASPIYDEQSRRMQVYRRQKVAHEEDSKAHPKPTLPTLYVSDITTEALARVMQDNPRGVTLIRDELTAWVAGMDQYRSRGRGADRQFFLAAWAGEPVSVHRKGQDEPVFVPHPFLSVVGGLPPDLLPRLRGDHQVSDGFLDRILFAFPEPPPAVGENWACVSDAAAETWLYRRIAASIGCSPADVRRVIQRGSKSDRPCPSARWPPADPGCGSGSCPSPRPAPRPGARASTHRRCRPGCPTPRIRGGWAHPCWQGRQLTSGGLSAAFPRYFCGRGSPR